MRSGVYRILLNRAVETEQEIELEGSQIDALHFREVREGSIITLTDGTGADFRGRVTGFDGKRASVFVFEKLVPSSESRLKIVLLQALPDKERMELIIQKATELGVWKIIPFKSARSISLEERERKQRKAHRWQEIAIRAVQQSRRALVPEVLQYREFREALEAASADGLKIILWEKEGEHLKDVIRRIRGDTVFLMVGPEGGFTEEEVALAGEAGFMPVRMGSRIMRTETASLAVIAILQYELGDLG